MYAPVNLHLPYSPCDPQKHPSIGISPPPCIRTDANTISGNFSNDMNFTISGRVHRVILLQPHALYIPTNKLDKSSMSFQNIIRSALKSTNKIRIAISHHPDLRHIFTSMLESIGVSHNALKLIEFIPLYDENVPHQDQVGMLLPIPSGTALIVTTTLLEHNFRLGTLINYSDDIDWDILRLRIPFSRNETADVSKYSAQLVTSKLITFDELLQCQSGYNISFLSDSFDETHRSQGNARLAMNISSSLRHKNDHRDELPRIISPILHRYNEPSLINSRLGRGPMEFNIDSYISLSNPQFGPNDIRTFAVNSSSLPGVDIGDRIVLKKQLHLLENGRYFVMGSNDNRNLIKNKTLYLKSAIELQDIDSVFLTHLKDINLWSPIDIDKSVFQSHSDTSIDVTLTNHDEPTWPIRRGRWVRDGDTFFAYSSQSGPSPVIVTIIRADRPAIIRVNHHKTKPSELIHQESSFPPKCTFHSDCPYFMSNTVYKNYRGGCYNNGTCEMPIGWVSGDIKRHYPNIPQSDDYAFPDDQLERIWAGLGPV